MYILRHTQIDDPVRLYRFMQDFNFATLVTVEKGIPLVTHLPFVIDADAGILKAHLARANPQWKTFAPDQEVLVIFQGDHGYITPSWYEAHPSVPTWNYSVVHAYGLPHVIEEETAVAQHLKALIDQHERDFLVPYRMDDLPQEYMERQLKALVAFEITITRLEGKFKLSQNRTPAEQQQVIDGLSASHRSSDHALANLMREELFGK